MVRILSAGDTALTVEFGETAERRLSEAVLALDARLAASRPRGVVELIPTLRSLTIHYDPCVTSAAELSCTVEPLLNGLERQPLRGRRWVIPVCYSADFAPDLKEVAERSGLSPKQVIDLHTSVDYRIYMLGFLPGYPYMGEVPQQLRLPRRQSPRTSVPAGSVAIASMMTAIYPLESPGGWHLIGRSPVRLFEAERDPAVLLAPGDRVRFAAITRAEFDELEKKSRAGSWLPTAQEVES
ncbi:MAG TPA: 5-oxoprolinase subunit PxpB [Hyphomicrobiaceae bacterium]|nr:5-oxoprolinase subunit PxpB [Hyphomicrobiaceae bacterium]